MAITLEITTPEHSNVIENVQRVTFPTQVGELTILPDHQPILGQTVTGEMSYTDANGQTQEAVIDNGFYILKGNKLSLLVEGAVNADEIDLEAIKEAQQRAQAALDAADANNTDPAEIEEFERIVRFSLAQRLAKK